MHRQLDTVEQLSEAIGQEAVVVVKRGQAVARVVGAGGVDADAAGLEHAHQFRTGEPRLGDVFENLMRVNEVKLTVGKSGEALRVVPMSDAAARSLAGLSGPLLHSDSLKLKDGELLLAILNGDGCEPCSFHGKYRRTPEGWLRADNVSYAPRSWT